MRIPALKPIEKKKYEPHWIPVEEIRYSTVKGRDLWFYTEQDRYVLHGSMYYDWCMLLSPLGFAEVDRGILANMSLARAFDKEMRMLYFDDPPASSFCTVSRNKMHIIPDNYPHIRVFQSEY